MIPENITKAREILADIKGLLSNLNRWTSDYNTMRSNNEEFTKFVAATNVGSIIGEDMDKLEENLSSIYIATLEIITETESYLSEQEIINNG